MLSESIKSAVVAAIDAEIANLQTQKELVLSGKFGQAAPAVKTAKGGKGGKREMSEESRRAIGDAARERHRKAREEKARLAAIGSVTAPEAAGAVPHEVIPAPAEAPGDAIGNVAPAPKPTRAKPVRPVAADRATEQGPR